MCKPETIRHYERVAFAPSHNLNHLWYGHMLFRVDSGRRTLRAEELSGDVESLAAHDNDLLTVEQLLCDRAGKAAEQMALAVDDLCHC